MTPEDIRKHPPRVLTLKQREDYFANGFLAAEGLVSEDWVQRLNAVSQMFLDRSRQFSESGDTYDLAPEHNAEKPHVRRLRAPTDRNPLFWEFASASVLADIAADLLGPDVKFHSGKLNYKWPGNGEVVKWHQDIPAWPHTNYSLVTLGVYLDPVTAKEGPLTCVPGSHKGDLFTHYGPDGVWSGSISAADLAAVDLDAAVELTGPAGTVSALNCRVIHGSRDNFTDRVRPLLLFVYSSADAFPWMPSPTPSSQSGEIVRGAPARMVHLDPRPCQVPPDWSKQGYGSIFASQNNETEAR
jgi:ectoine hydroxylase-related dioxygenase (phytanoyl-CoA dioxygenase family)